MSTEQLAQALRKKIDDYHAATVARCNSFGNRGHYEAMEKENAEAAALDGLLKALAAHDAEKAKGAHVATVADIDLSRHKLEWENGQLSGGTKLFAAPVAVPLTDEEMHAIGSALPGGWKGLIVQWGCRELVKASVVAFCAKNGLKLEGGEA